jgi:hypothetical protein
MTSPISAARTFRIGKTLLHDHRSETAMGVGRIRLKPTVKVLREVVFSLSDSLDPPVSAIEGQIFQVGQKNRFPDGLEIT